ncbi:uncharacterized protein DUF3850 [Mycobacterium sp. BK086]|uniref:ASCH/PUA domain-containing protein n=1 Tax=Mycobacterium sp. BK086 TaxID=2512165 RepID=UPI00105D25A9|nr:uncharacterized protein DUF3850 [Mycobacterium sp. BK086]
MTIHDLKTWPDMFEAIQSKVKTVELRKDDRGFKVGDLLRLAEWSPESGYSGRSCLRCVTHLVPGGQFGLEPGYVAMSLSPRWRGRNPDS